MKKIIKEKLYDTDTATLICKCDYGDPSETEIYIYEELYKSPNGAFFMFGYGGKYRRRESYEASYDPHVDIHLISDEEARAFAEEYGTAEDYVKAFGEPEEG